MDRAILVRAIRYGVIEAEHSQPAVDGLVQNMRSGFSARAENDDIELAVTHRLGLQLCRCLRSGLIARAAPRASSRSTPMHKPAHHSGAGLPA